MNSQSYDAAPPSHERLLQKKKLPDSPGVYFFLGRNRKILYIGRATSLRDRVRSYFRGDILESRGPWIAKMLPIVKAIDFRKTDSVLEAILLEAKLIKKFQPPYNTDEKDDKSFNYVVITKEDFPAVFRARQTSIDSSSLKVRGQRSKVHSQKLLAVYGPFPNDFQLQTAMKIIRRIFPYRDLECKLQTAPSEPRDLSPLIKGVPESASTRKFCSAKFVRARAGDSSPLIKGVPESARAGDSSPLIKGVPESARAGVVSLSTRCVSNNPPASEGSAPFIKGDSLFGNPCFNRQIGLCPGVCTGEISKKDYAKIMRNIRLLFEGKKPRLLRLLKREMKEAAKAQKFERAGELKKQLFALAHIQDVALLNREVETSRLPSTLFRGGIKGGVYRIEAYDLSHFGGKEIVGAMAVVKDGAAKRNEYRLFRLRTVATQNEAAGLREILRRRFNHPEWKSPDLIVVDGNEVQRKVAEAVLKQLKKTIPVVAVVKDDKHNAREIIGLADIYPRSSAFAYLRESAVLLANSEAHRFALGFGRKRLRRAAGLAVERI